MKRRTHWPGLPRTVGNHQRPYRTRNAPRASQACRACAAAKAKCDNDRHCKRCRKRGIRCERAFPVRGDTGCSEGDAECHDTAHHSLSDGLTVDVPSMFDASTFTTEAQAQDMGLLNISNSMDTPITADILSPGTHFLSGILDTGFLDQFHETAESGEQRVLSGTGHTLILDSNTTMPLNDVNLNVDPSDRLSVLETDTSFPRIFTAGKEVVSLVSDAFGELRGHWLPANYLDYRAEEESNLSLHPGSTFTDDESLSSEITLAAFETIGTATRDHILTTVMDICHPRSKAAVISGFPELSLLKRLLLDFFNYHAAQTVTWIHIPTIRVAEAPMALIMACISAAAIRSPQASVQRFGFAMQEILIPHIFKKCERENMHTRNLQYLHALALQIEIGLWSGDKRKMEMANGFMGLFVNMVRNGGYFRYSTYQEIFPSTEDSGRVLEEKWRRWAVSETFKRLVCHIQIHCSQAAIITFVRPPLSCAELSLPLPQSRRLWSAPSAEKWKEIFVSLPPSNPQSQAHSPVLLLGEISELGSLPSIYDSELAHFVVVHSLLSLVLEYKQTQSIFAVDSHVSRKENLLAEDAGYNRFSRIAQDLRISYESSPSPRVLDWSFLLELTLMHLNAPCDQIELLLGKEGEQNMHASYQNLSQWVSTVQARRAVWHAGQMLRLLRLRPLDQLNDFDAFGAYHASLCLLAYGMLSDTIPGIQADRSTCIFDADDIFLDSAESLKSQRWITLNRGIPMISGIGSRGEGGRSERITLTSSRALLQSTTQLIRIKFAAKGQKISHFVYNICQLLHILGQLEQQSSSS